MNNYEPFFSSYTRVQYNDYKSDKLTTRKQLIKEKEKALNSDVNEIGITEYTKQSNGVFSGRKANYFYSGGTWTKLIA